MTDLISRADAVKTVIRKCSPICAWKVGTQQYPDCVVAEINALPSADAVSREECDECKTDKEGVLLQQLAELQGDYETMKNAYEDALADAEWIPCSERLPSDDEYVIVSVLDDHGDTPWKYTTVAWLCNGTWIADNEILFGDVIAWMPLPKPYKGGDSE